MDAGLGPCSRPARLCAASWQQAPGVSPLNMVFIHQQTIITTEKRDITA
jgi:hypothetical protein